MNQEKEYIRLILCRTIWGQAQIRSLLNITMQTRFRKILLLQKKAYSSLEAQIRAWIAQKNIHLREPDPLLLLLSCKLNCFRLKCHRKDSQTISYMIIQSTQGIIDSFTVLHGHSHKNSALCLLAQTLLDCESAFILQLQELL